MGGILTQLRPPKPTFTETNVPSLAGRVFIVTGGNDGIGFELVKMLYAKGGTVYIASRNEKKIDAAIRAIQSLYSSDSTGSLQSLHIDLADLSTVAPAVSKFLKQESRLDILFNNAGISTAPVGSVSMQGHEAHLATNCLGPYLLTTLLIPILSKTASISPPGTVRVVFTTSGIVDLKAPKGGMIMSDVSAGKQSDDVTFNYAVSKTGNWFLASELDKRFRSAGILAVAQSPGTIRTKGWNNAPSLMKFLMAPFLYEPKMGAYTELWVGLSPVVQMDDGGRFAIPWGRWHPSLREDILVSLKTKEDGGTGVADEFWKWCETQVKEYSGGHQV